MKYALLFFALLSFHAVCGQTEWINPAPGDWHDSSSWSNGIPAAGNDAIIPAGSAITVSQEIDVASFDITNNGSIDVLSSFRLSRTLLNQAAGSITFWPVVPTPTEQGEIPTIEIETGGQISNYGSLNCTNSSELNFFHVHSLGSIINYGVCTIAWISTDHNSEITCQENSQTEVSNTILQGGGQLNVFGTLILLGNTEFEGTIHIGNSGVFQNYGQLLLDSGQLVLHGLVENHYWMTCRNAQVSIHGQFKNFLDPDGGSLFLEQGTFALLEPLGEGQGQIIHEGDVIQVGPSCTFEIRGNAQVITEVMWSCQGSTQIGWGAPTFQGDVFVDETGEFAVFDDAQLILNAALFNLGILETQYIEIPEGGYLNNLGNWQCKDITNYGFISNEGPWYLNDNGSYFNGASGTIENNEGGYFFCAANCDNYGDFYNNSNMDLFGSFLNEGTFNNNGDAVINNYGVVINSSATQNLGAQNNGVINSCTGEWIGPLPNNPPLFSAGCVDPNACNYDASAGCDDGSCTYPGCTDSNACNYDLSAGCDDGLCNYLGCTDSTACNYDLTAGCDDGSCEYISCAGCTDPNADNYNPTAIIDDGSCIISGCTDPLACNYDAFADNVCVGCCVYEDQGPEVTAAGFASSSAQAFGVDAGADPCIYATLTMFDSFGDGWNGATYTIFDTDGVTVLATGDLDTATAGDGVTSGIEVIGCLPTGTYSILVGGGSFDGEISWEIAVGEVVPCEPLLPDNDSLCAAEYLACGVTSAGSNSTASDDVGANDCGDPGAGVWYSFVGDGLLHNINTCGSDIDTEVYIFVSDDNTCTGVLSCATDAITGAFLAELDDTQANNGCEDLDTDDVSLDFVSAAGVSYYIYVAYNNATGGGAFTIMHTCDSFVAGCTDNTACNFDPSASIDDGGCEFTSCAGCMDSDACNYDVTASLDDASCTYPGCTNSIACNYQPSAGCDDGSCTYPGCTTSLACNYAPSAGCDDGSCTFPGCTDSLACNYQPAAGCDDGSCTYPGCTNSLACNYVPSAGCDDGSCTFPGCTDSLACNYQPAAGCDDGSCTFPGCTDSLACNYDSAAGCNDGSCTYPGCTDSLACNYQPAAGCDDGSCTFPGCTDSLACNYQPTAACDDSSCAYPGCTDPATVNYDPTAGCDDGSCILTLGSMVIDDVADLMFAEQLLIEVFIEDGLDLYAAYGSLSFDPSLYSFVEGIPGPYLGDQVLITPPVVNGGLLDFGMTKTGAQPGTNGNGLFYTLVFEHNTAITDISQPLVSVFNNAQVDAFNANGAIGALFPEGDINVQLNFEADVWPGDCDANGEVTYLDLLPIGVYYNQAGPQRDNPSIVWEAQLAPLWGTDLTPGNGDYYRVFVDSNGDGVINIADQAAIGFNLDQTVPPGLMGTAPKPPVAPNLLNTPVTLSAVATPAAPVLPADVQVTFEVYANTDALNMTDLYGMGLAITFPDGWVGDASQASVSFDASDLGTSGVDFLQFVNASAAVVEVAFTRTSPMTSAGAIHLFDVTVPLDEQLPNGVYTANITTDAANDAQGGAITVEDTSASIVLVNQALGLTVTLVTSGTVCQGGGLGIAQASVTDGTAPYTFDWGGADPNNLDAGTYTLTVTDSEDRSATVEFVIPEGLALCGCTYPDANNYDSTAQVDDGSCTFDLGGPTSGCSIYDFNENGEIDTADLLTILGVYGSVCDE